MALGSDGAAPRAVGDTAQDGAAAPPGQAPEELVEVQLRAILEATGTSAGAVCLFDQHQELLRLAVEIGLSDEGCRRLRSVRRGAATTWDMPLHSLLNRRVYLIESAAKNRYVPPLVDDVAKVRSVACVPLYDGSTPVGSLILVAMAPRTFGERQIRLLEQPVRELVSHIGSMRKRVSIAAPHRGTRPSLSATATAQPAAVMFAGPSSPGVKVAPGSASVSSSIQAAVDRARAELERLRARLTEADEATATERRRADALSEEQEALRAERDDLIEKLAMRTSEAAPLADRVATLETALEEARRSEASLRAELDHANVAVASDNTTAAEALSARLAELEATNDALRKQVTELDAANAALRGRAAELEAADVAARADAEQRLAGVTADTDARLAAAAEVETRATTLAAECDALRGRLADVNAAHERDRAQTDACHASALADVEARAAGALETCAEWQRRCEVAEGELAVIRAAAGSHSEQLDTLAHERAQLEAELAHGRTQLEAQLAATRERETALARRVAELEADLDRTRTEDSQLRDGFAHLESLIQTGADASGASAATDALDLDGAATASTFEVVELDDTSPLLDDGAAMSPIGDALLIEEVTSSPPAETPQPSPEVAAPAVVATASPPEGLLVVDTDSCWMAAVRGALVRMFAPDAVPTDETRPERLLVNLAAPSALAAFANMREAGITAPAFGCIVVPGQARGLLVGRLELATRPIDPDALLACLRGTFVRGTRVVTAGADVDGLISLRQALARLGASVSMAWDAKQAGDLLAMVHPDVAIIDLELPPKDGCALVARMGLIQPAPLTVVIPKPTDTATTFAATLTPPDLARMTLPVQELLTRVLAHSLRRTPAAPARR